MTFRVKLRYLVFNTNLLNGLLVRFVLYVKPIYILISKSALGLLRESIAFANDYVLKNKSNFKFVFV